VNHDLDLLPALMSAIKPAGYVPASVNHLLLSGNYVEDLFLEPPEVKKTHPVRWDEAPGAQNRNQKLEYQAKRL